MVASEKKLTLWFQADDIKLCADFIFWIIYQFCPIDVNLFFLEINSL